MLIGVSVQESEVITYDVLENFSIKLNENKVEVYRHKHNYDDEDIVDINDEEEYLGHLTRVVGIDIEEFADKVTRKE